METRLTNLPFVNMYRKTYSNRIGENRKYYFASRKDGSALSSGVADVVLIIPIVLVQNPRTKVVKKEVIIISQFRPPVDHHVWEFPAGLIDPGEDIETTAVREVKEEVGLNVVEMRVMKHLAYTSPGLTDESMAIVVAKCEGTPTVLNNEPDEDINAILSIPRDEIQAMLDSNEYFSLKGCFDVKAFLGLNLLVNDDSLWE